VRDAGVDENFHFSQDDLRADDVMLLDVVAETFLWIGPRSSERERARAAALARRYVEARAEHDGRDVDAPTSIVPAGAEPPAFARRFVAWDVALARRVATSGVSGGDGAHEDPYEKKLERARAANPPPVPGAEVKLRKTPDKAKREGEGAKKDIRSEEDRGGPVVFAKLRPTPPKPTRPPGAGEDAAAAASSDSSATEIPSDVAGPDTLPPGSITLTMEVLTAADVASRHNVVVTEKESYLSDAEFAGAFGMGKAEFAAMPLWRRQAAKKKVGLF
jgi:hypothetical protein